MVGAEMRDITVVQLQGQHPSIPPRMTYEEQLAQMKNEAERKKRGAAAAVIYLVVPRRERV
jgi:hypothetical protein